MESEVLRVKDWNTRFENNRSRDLKRLEWVPIPNRMDDVGYLELVSDDAEGAARLGCWLAIVMIASRCCTRGTLVSSHGRPYTPEMLGRVSRLPVELIRETISVSISLGWLERVPGEEIRESQEGATIPQDGAENLP